MVQLILVLGLISLKLITRRTNIQANYIGDLRRGLNPEFLKIQVLLIFKNLTLLMFKQF